MRSARMTVRAAAFITATAASLCFASTASAQRWKANLAPEVPGATGSGFAFFNLSGSALSISANWSGLSGPTTVSHIHCCTAVPSTGTAFVAVTPGTLPGFPAGVTAGSYNVTLDLTDLATFTAAFVNGFGGGTAAGAEAALVAGFGNDVAYFNIHTTAYPGGEIRGFLREVPEPTALLLSVIALSMLGAAALRRRAL